MIDINGILGILIYPLYLWVAFYLALYIKKWSTHFLAFLLLTAVFLAWPIIYIVGGGDTSDMGSAIGLLMVFSLVPLLFIVSYILRSAGSHLKGSRNTILLLLGMMIASGLSFIYGTVFGLIALLLFIILLAVALYVIRFVFGLRNKSRTSFESVVRIVIGLAILVFSFFILFRL